MKHLRIFTLIGLALLALQTAGQKVFTPELLWKLGRVSELTLSPDQKTAIYGVTWYNINDNKGNRDIYSMNLADGRTRKITDQAGSELSAVYRPDGKKIGYLSAESGSMQLWEMNPDGSGKKQVSDIEGGFNGFRYSPDMKHIVYAADVKLEKSAADMHPDLPKADAMIYDDLMYRHWDSWHDYAYSHVFVAPYSDGSVGEGKDLMPGEKWDSPVAPFGGMEQVVWTPDGKHLAYVSKKLHGKDYALSTNSDIYLYTLETGTTVNLTDFNPGYDMDPVFSPDGSKMAWRSMATPGFEADKDRIMLMEFPTRVERINKKRTLVVTTQKSGFRDLSANFDQSSNNFAFSPDGQQLYFISGTQATYQIYRMNIATQQITQLTQGDHDVQSFNLAGNDIIFTKMQHDLPTEIFRLSPNGTETQLSFTNREVLDGVTLARSEKRWVKTTDGRDMLVWVILPPNFDPNKQYPALLYCQGGPQSAVSQFFSYRWNFQMLAANDYVVVAPNRRGLPTFGQEWNDQISGDYGGQNMKDYLSAIDDVKKESWVDENRLGAVGASYGGYSVYWLAGNHDKRFKAFIAHCGIFNFESMYLETEEMFFVNYDYKGAFWEKPRPKSYDFSPHNFVGNWDTPMLVIHGGYDFRIPYTQGMQAFNANRLQDIPARFLFFPNETHFVTKPQNSILWNREFFGWLDKYLK